MLGLNRLLKVGKGNRKGPSREDHLSSLSFDGGLI